MANELQTPYTTGKILYAIVRKRTGEVWNGAEFVTFSPAMISTYAIAMLEEAGDSGYYQGNFPSVTPDLYLVSVYERTSLSPAASDPVVATGTIPWRGLDIAYTDALAEQLSALVGAGSGSVEIDHNYQVTDSMRYITPEGVGIDNANIYVFRKSDYDAGRRSEDYIIAQSTTDSEGRWRRPIFLNPGVYTVQFFKAGAYGPDSITLTVD